VQTLFMVSEGGLSNDRFYHNYRTLMHDLIEVRVRCGGIALVTVSISVFKVKIVNVVARRPSDIGGDCAAAWPLAGCLGPHQLALADLLHFAGA
jgi:hypothetical protein